MKNIRLLTSFLLLSLCFFCPLKGDLANWSLLAPNTSPSGRNQASMAFDPISNTLILFGGLNLTGVLNDTWAYNGTNNTWTQLFPSTSPQARHGASMAFDPSSGTIILFGGVNVDGFLNDTWAYNATNNSWVNLSPTNPPSAREGSSMTFDPPSGTIILFGGSGNSYLNDTWAYNGTNNTWTLLSPLTSPLARNYASMAFDPPTETIILFGGSDNSFLGDTWAYDGANNTWTQLFPSTSPQARFYASMAFDPLSDTLILFGGNTNTGFSNQTWSYNGPENTWNQLFIATSPSTLISPSMAFDPVSRRIILFGGYSGSSYSNQTWAFIFQAPPQIVSSNSATFL